MSYTPHHYSDSFCATQLADLRADIAANTSFNLVAMPGVGITYFLQALAQDSAAEFVFINSYELQEFTRDALSEQLARKLGLDGEGPLDLATIHEALVQRTKTAKQLVIVFNRLDRLSAVLDQSFYDNLRYLRDAARGKICIIFVSSLPLTEISIHPVQGMASLLTKTNYFAGYSDTDVLEVFGTSAQQAVDPRAIRYAGGHHLLLQILTRCQNLNNPLSDPMVELVVKDLYLGLDLKRRKALETTVARGTTPDDAYLLGAGYLHENSDTYTTFTPLLAEYVLTLGRQHLPLKEKRLMKILSMHRGKIVSKQSICDFVWPERDGIVTDWALNALVYRLRRHSAFDNQRYTIESRKGEGYILFDHS